MAWLVGQFTIVHIHALVRFLHCNLPACHRSDLVVPEGGRGDDVATAAPFTCVTLVFATLIGLVAFGTIEIAEKTDI
ncbi:MAG: hypothetical protein KDJ47_05170 [Hyphomicrobiaceae bacterium]|nr:hypothetical protein [Hyphomicrobiaceae bacterium]